MAGKQIGEFSFKVTSLTFSSGPNDGVVLQINCEGRALSGTGAVTVTVTPGKSGSYTALGALYLDNGDITPSRGSGSFESNFESSGTHGWRTQGDFVISMIARFTRRAKWNSPAAYGAERCSRSKIVISVSSTASRHATASRKQQGMEEGLKLALHDPQLWCVAARRAGQKATLNGGLHFGS